MWNVDYTKRFLKELAVIPKAVQAKAEAIVFQKLKTEDPFGLRYLEKMTGYQNKYKIRIGKYRIGITINKREKLIICQRMLHRKDIYRVFP